MTAFAKFVFRGGQVGGKQIIAPQTLEQMSVDQFSGPRDPETMGLGWKTARVLGSELLVWHDGGPGEGIGSLVALLPERKLGIVVFANEVSFEGNLSVSLADEILELMLETKYGVSIPKEQVPKPIDLDRSLLDAYAGKYITFGQVMDVSSSRGGLKASIQGMKLDLVPVDQTRFRVSHWLLRLGLADLFQLPAGLDELEIEFLVGDEAGEDIMIVNLAGISYQICPRYPEFADVPALWQELAGEYELLGRSSSGRAENAIVGRSEIQIKDGVLVIPGVVGPLKPISETEIVILGGPFAGETMLYDPGTGYIYHQWIVHRPIVTD
jgi:hypothetical protein